MKREQGSGGLDPVNVQPGQNQSNEWLRGMTRRLKVLRHRGRQDVHLKEKDPVTEIQDVEKRV